MPSSSTVGIAEWYSPVVSDSNLLHPRPGSAESLQSYFPEVDTKIWTTPVWYPSRKGESVEEVHARVDGFLTAFGTVLSKVKEIDGRRPLLITHAATAIVLVRSLTGDRRLPLKVGCCSLSELHPKPDVKSVSPLGSYYGVKLADGSHMKGGSSREWGFDDIEIEEGRVCLDSLKQ
jgi:transcription factor C subunit 7